jgi:Caspase domain
MNRRAFLSATAAVLCPLASRVAFAQPALPGSRAAVVIGVNRAGNLPRLSAAASGANRVATWLEGEGFEVKRFTDDGGKKVRGSDIGDVVIDLVRRGTLSQLVIYFSGHGFLLGNGEHWLLSSAPDNPNEAINLSGSIDLARDSAIKNVVFISDTCRSTADSLSATRVEGIKLFPNSDIESNIHTYVDRFFSTRPGKAAFEVKVDVSVPQFQGIFTSSFLSAFESPMDTMVDTIGEVSYVPTRKLESFLESDVERRAQEKSIRLNQRPDSIIESDGTAYIGRAVKIISSQPTPQRQVSIRDLVNSELQSAGSGLFSPVRIMSSAEVQKITAETGFDKARDLVRQTQTTRSFETQAGFIVFGAPVGAVASSRNLEVEIFRPDSISEPGLVRVRLRNGDIGSVAISFGKGNATILAAVYGFVGSVLVEEDKVANVSYLPAVNGERWSDYTQVRDQLDRLRTAVATAAQYGEFRVDGGPEVREKSAEQLADRIRVLKGIDPTLGLYAAYAYFDVGLRQKVRSVRDFMRADLGADLFDVALLARVNIADRRIVPFCPMLTQGWNLLDSQKTIRVPEANELRSHLRPALWTTFDGDGFGIVQQVLQRS